MIPSGIRTPGGIPLATLRWEWLCRPILPGHSLLLYLTVYIDAHPDCPFKFGPRVAIPHTRYVEGTSPTSMVKALAEAVEDATESMIGSITRKVRPKHTLDSDGWFVFSL